MRIFLSRSSFLCCVKLNLSVFFAAGSCLGLMLMAPTVLAEENEPATVTLARQIVSDYRERRDQCAAATDEVKTMCYYRLKIGRWDYHESKKLLADYKRGGEQVAASLQP